MEQEKLIELVKQAQAGDSAAIEQLLTYAHTPVSYQCRKFMATPEDAEDLTQEVLLVIYEKLNTLTQPAAFHGWVKRIAATRCMNALNRTHVELSFAEDEDGNSFVDTIEEQDTQKIPDAAIDNAETSRMVVELIDALPEAQRICTYLYYYDELSIQEIAKLTAVSENTVKSRLNYARKAIKEGVLEHEKNGVKLYGLSPIPFLLHYLRMAAQAGANEGAAAICVSKIMVANAAAAGAATAATTAAAAAGGASAAAGTGWLAKLLGLPLVVKVIAAVTAVALAAGIGGAVLSRAQNVVPVISPQTEPTAAATEATVPPVTEPEATEPKVTAPMVTEPEVTEPKVTEPEATEPEVTEPEVTEPEYETNPEGTEPKETEQPMVSYDPVSVCSKAIAKCQAGGMITTTDNLAKLLSEGKITQEEYNSYYPYDGLGYYSVFVETDLNRASTTSGRKLGSEDEIADYIAEMMLLETEPVFNIEYAGVYNLNGTDFYEFRCYR